MERWDSLSVKSVKKMKSHHLPGDSRTWIVDMSYLLVFSMGW